MSTYSPDYAPAVGLPLALRNTWSDDQAWLDSLWGHADECARQWDLALEKRLACGNVSLVVPAGDVVLKLIHPKDYEEYHEPDALERWAGNGAVRLVERDDRRCAILVERCQPGACAFDGDDWLGVVEMILPRLSSDPGAPHPFRVLAQEALRWESEVSQRYGKVERPLDRSLLDAALEVFRTVDPGAAFLANQDLHGSNILSAEREPWWLVIDPKPIVGERELDGVGLLRNAAWRGETTRCLDMLVGLGFDRDRTRAWGSAHAIAWGYDDKNGQWVDDQLEAARAILSA